jgi:hypothetical protein
VRVSAKPQVNALLSIATILRDATSVLPLLDNLMVISLSVVKSCGDEISMVSFSLAISAELLTTPQPFSSIFTPFYKPQILYF